MTPLPILVAAVFLGPGNYSSKIVRGSLSEICKSVIEIFWNEAFIVRNTVKKKKKKKWTILMFGCYL